MKIFPGRNKLKIFPRKLYKNISVSAHPEPDAARVAGQHGAAPQADGHHAEEPLRQGAPPAEGPGADIHPVLADSISTDIDIKNICRTLTISRNTLHLSSCEITNCI